MSHKHRFGVHITKQSIAKLQNCIQELFAELNERRTKTLFSSERFSQTTSIAMVAGGGRREKGTEWVLREPKDRRKKFITGFVGTREKVDLRFGNITSIDQPEYTSFNSEKFHEQILWGVTESRKAI